MKFSEEIKRFEHNVRIMALKDNYDGEFLLHNIKAISIQVEALEKYNSEMLMALIDEVKKCIHDTGSCSEKSISIIEKATGKKWSEICEKT